MFEKEVGAINKARRALNKKMSLAVLLTLAAIFFSGVVVWQFADSERARDLYNWQIRLGLVADRQKSELENWVDKQFSELAKLSDNQSLQLYMTELEFLGNESIGAMIEDEPAETVFLRNLINVTAQKSGFVSQQNAQNVRANVRQPGDAGIALINNLGEVIVSTRGTPPFTDKLGDFVKNLPAGNRILLDIYRGTKDMPSMAFAVPVFSIQGERVAEQKIGTVIGIKTVADEVFPLLEVPYPEFSTVESILVRVDEGSISYISPLLNGKGPMELKMARNTGGLAAAAAIEDPGNFLNRKKDYRFKKVLASGRKIEGTNWTLIHKIDFDEAMSSSDSRLSRLVGVFILGVLVIFVGIVAAWRHGSSIKAEKVALRYKNLYNRFKSQENLLRLVSDNQPDSMFLVSTDDDYFYANQKAADDAGMKVSDIVGKSMASVLGKSRSEEYKKLNSEALFKRKPVQDIKEFNDRVLQTSHIPLETIPVVIDEEENPGVLIVEQDITQLVEEKEKHERTLEQLINSLVALVDRHDPYAAHHSSRVSKLAMDVAKEMSLDDVLVETAEVSGRLMNVGKILLPADLLTKKGALNEKEKKNIHESIYASAAFLREITFQGPVVETIDQCLENWDGSGPKGLKGEDIVITARIVSAANAYVAMVSPRSYREGMSHEDATNAMLKEVDRKYQRSVVAALISYIENHGNSEDFVVKID